MKTLKSFLFIGLFLLSQVAVNAQMAVSVDVYPQFALDGYNTGIGSNIGFGLEDIGIRLGYSSFGAKDMDVQMSVIPITAYYNHFIGKGKFRLVICGNVGGIYMKTEGSVTTSTYSHSISTPYGKRQVYDTNTTDLSSSKIYFGGDAGLGFDYKFKQKISLFSSAKMNFVLSDPPSSWVGMNLGIRYLFIGNAK
jgi:hypothetical protein